MAFTEAQVKSLEAKLSAKRIKTRQANGVTLAYVEGWHVIAEANRIFGYDAWDRRTRTNNCVWSGTRGEFYHAAYTAKVCVTVRAGDITVVREGSGTGEGKASTPGQAHELALKGAETDATKRALATFGNPFGLALYDREKVDVRKARSEKASPPIGPWILHSASGADEAASSPVSLASSEGVRPHTRTTSATRNPEGSAALRHSPPPHPYHWQGAGVVAGAQYRSPRNCKGPLATEP
jgi:DNA recombination protein Rad52